MLTLLGLIILSTLVSTIMVYAIAYRRKADTEYWLKAGLVYGVLALPFVFFARRKKRF